MLHSIQFNFGHIIDRLVDKFNSHVRIEHCEVSKGENIYEWRVGDTVQTGDASMIFDLSIMRWLQCNRSESWALVPCEMSSNIWKNNKKSIVKILCENNDSTRYFNGEWTEYFVCSTLCEENIDW